MSQLFEMCQTIVNFPKSEMTIEEIIESMDIKGANPHSIRCAMSKMASQNVLVEPTKKHRGRVKIYKKRKDIDDQWDWMMAHKGRSGRLVMPNSVTVVKSRSNSSERKSLSRKREQSIPVSTRELRSSNDRILRAIAEIGKTLKSIEIAIRENTKAVQSLEMVRPTVIVRKQKV